MLLQHTYGQIYFDGLSDIAGQRRNDGEVSDPAQLSIVQVPGKWFHGEGVFRVKFIARRIIVHNYDIFEVSFEQCDVFDVDVFVREEAGVSVEADVYVGFVNNVHL